MSLEELRAQAETEEATEAEQPEAEEENLEQPEETEAEQEESEEPEVETAEEESDDFELELEGEPEPDRQKYDPVEVLQHKLSRERKKKRQARSEVDELKNQVQQLTDMLQGGNRPQPQAPQRQPQGAPEPKFPAMDDDHIQWDRQKYDAAVKRYFAEMDAYQKQAQQAEQAQRQQRERLEDMTKSLASRAAEFSKENKVSVDRVAEALETATSEVDQSTGIDGSLAYLLDSVGDGGERVAYYIGTNSNAMDQVKSLLREDPKGFKAIAYMTRMADKLKPKHSRKISKAPEPDQPLKGDSRKGSVSAKRVQEMWDKATTPEEMLAARQKARELGVKLDT